MINLDMVGRLRRDPKSDWPRLLSLLHPVQGLPVLPACHAFEGFPANFLGEKDRLMVQGTGTARKFHRLLDQINMKYGFSLHKSPGGVGPSDHSSFYEKKIPVLFFFTGAHADYHQPTDTAEKINVFGLSRIVDFATDLVEHLARSGNRPVYVKVTEPRRDTPEGRIPRIRFRPDYGDGGQGVLLGGVVPGGPADKAGLKEGDRIISIGGQTIKDLSHYMTVIARHKPGETIEFGIVRNGKKMTVKVVPE
ncbi:MAG: hypothetical protein KatS3mg105_0086 [Gemmatales bacterium]|nr:MAG: hypothetical protein KatS3mg105_0086 [Gemmatales bacterium]